MPAVPQIFGIDPSLNNFATVWKHADTYQSRVLEANKNRESANLRVRAWQALAENAVRLVLDLAKHYGTNPIAVIEGYSMSSNRPGQELLFELGGIVRMKFAVSHVPIVEVPPSSLKKFVTGQGKATKAQMTSALKREHCDLDFKQSDQWDALGLVKIGDAMLDPRTIADHATRALVADYRSRFWKIHLI